ncbi:MAG: hypothetical protein DMG64_17705 [Acidobacteria bacterium]|nr:MAG: hypothetical protein DMG64_17705 [Acidobacteriota bacterium]
MELAPAAAIPTWQQCWNCLRASAKLAPVAAVPAAEERQQRFVEGAEPARPAIQVLLVGGHFEVLPACDDQSWDVAPARCDSCRREYSSLALALAFVCPVEERETECPGPAGSLGQGQPFLSMKRDQERISAG